MSNGSLDDIIDIVHRKGDDDVTKNEVSNRYRFFFFYWPSLCFFYIEFILNEKKKERVSIQI